MKPADFPRAFRENVDASRNVVVTTHINPDGDALGSEVALARFLRTRGVEVRIVNRDPTPEILRFIESDEVAAEVYDPALHDPLFAACDRVYLVDNSAPDRLGTMERVMRSVADKVVCIDHHPSRDRPWGVGLVDDHACATTVLVYELTRAAGWEPDREAAEALYVGLATDTGFFRFNSTNARGHEVAAALLRAGADSARTYRRIYERNSLAFTHLLGHALADAKLDGDGQIVHVRLTAECLSRTGSADVDTAEVMTLLLAIDRIRVALLFRELDNGTVKVSLRSKGPIDVHALASEFGGGGHRNASGIVLAAPLAEVAETILDRAREAVRDVPG